MAIHLTVGEQIRYARKARGLSLERLAGEAGISKSSLSRIELGEQGATTDDVDAIAKALGISIVLGDQDSATVAR